MPNIVYQLDSEPDSEPFSCLYEVLADIRKKGREISHLKFTTEFGGSEATGNFRFPTTADQIKRAEGAIAWSVREIGIDTIFVVQITPVYKNREVREASDGEEKT